jgi:hypothetical protein
MFTSKRKASHRGHGEEQGQDFLAQRRRARRGSEEGTRTLKKPGPGNFLPSDSPPRGPRPASLLPLLEKNSTHGGTEVTEKTKTFLPLCPSVTLCESSLLDLSHEDLTQRTQRSRRRPRISRAQAQSPQREPRAGATSTSNLLPPSSSVLSVALCASSYFLCASAPLRDLSSFDKRPHKEITEKRNFSREAAKSAKKTENLPSGFSFHLRPFAPSRLCARPTPSHSTFPPCLRASVRTLGISSVLSVALCESSLPNPSPEDLTQRTQRSRRRPRFSRAEAQSSQRESRRNTAITEERNFSRESAKAAKKTGNLTSAFSFLSPSFAPSRLCVRPSSSHSTLAPCLRASVRTLGISSVLSVPLCESSLLSLERAHAS